MSRMIKLNNAELNKDYIVDRVECSPTIFKNYGIYKGATIIPLFRSMGKNISAYKTYYGIFAIRNETAEKIRVKNG